MTCIVGLKHEDGVTIGGDSAGVGGGYDVDVHADEKVFRNGPYVMGFTTSFRMGQLLRYRLEPRDPYGDLHRFMVRDFIDAVRETLDEGGWNGSNDDGREKGGTFLVGVGGRLFTVYSDFQVAESRRSYMAVGCGHRYARGALYTTEGLDPDDRVRFALEAAAEHSGGVEPPFELVRADE